VWAASCNRESHIYFTCSKRKSRTHSNVISDIFASDAHERSSFTHLDGIRRRVSADRQNWKVLARQRVEERAASDE